MDKIKQKYNKDSNRLHHWDYSNEGIYFITICSYNRENLFGEIIENEEFVEMHRCASTSLNEYGNIVKNEIQKTEGIRENLVIYNYVIMPNNIHLLVGIKNLIPQNQLEEKKTHISASLQRKPKSISSFISGLKSNITKKINEIRNTPSYPVWQMNYYDHIVRDELEFLKISKYIIENPMNWLFDENNKANPIPNTLNSIRN
jgi:putative transposase